MKSHLQWQKVGNGEQRVNRPMTNKELYVYWFNVFMYDPSESLEKLLQSFIDSPSPYGENPEIIIQTIKDVLAERNE